MFTLQTIQIIGKAFSCAVGKCQYLHQVNLISFNFVENQLSPQSRGLHKRLNQLTEMMVHFLHCVLCSILKTNVSWRRDASSFGR